MEESNIMAKKVLIIDDDPFFTKTVIAQLSTHGFKVISANDGESGFEMARKYAPDFILLDFVMPDWSGVKTAEMLNDNLETRDIPVIFLTGMDLESIPAKFLNSSNYHVLSKPLKTDELLSILEIHLGM